MSLLDRPSSGEITIDENDIIALKEDQKIVFRRNNIGYIFQDYNALYIIYNCTNFDYWIYWKY